MKLFLLSVGFYLLVGEVVSGMKCYEAGMKNQLIPQSEIAKNHTLVECDKGSFCFTHIRIYDGHIMKGCTSQKSCIYGREDCTKSGTCEYNCCKLDGCNTASHMSSAAPLMVLFTIVLTCLSRLIF